MKWVIAVLVLIAAGGGYLWLQKGQQPTTVVTVQPVVEDLTLSLDETGRVVNDRVVKLTALVNGKIETTHFDVGDHVDANAVMATFDAQEAQALLDKATAEVQREQHAVNNTRLQVSRLKRLNASSGSSKQTFEDAQYEFRAATARMAVAESNLRLYDIKRNHTILTTPYAGIVIEKTSEAGQWMEAGTLLYTLVADEGFEIEARIDSSELNNIRMNMQANVFLEDQPDTTWQVPIHWLSPSVSNDDKATNNSFAVRLPVTDAAPRLLLNQQVQLSIPLKTAADALTLPTQALLPGAGANEVALVVNDKVQITPVTIGIETVDKVQITEGLEPNAQVILPTGRTFQTGDVVRVRAMP